MVILVSLQTPADIVNAALVRIGHPLRIGSLLDGSRAAKKALDIYGQTRDELLRAEDPDFARHDLPGTLLKQAPNGGYVPPLTWTNAYPPLPWWFEYSYPTDGIAIRSLRYVPIFVPVMDPQPNIFDIANDTGFSPAQKVILSNCGPAAVVTYTRRITDPATMDVGFVESLVASLADRLTVSLGDPKLLQAEMAADQAAATAEQTEMHG